jgi:hypothetical protein
VHANYSATNAYMFPVLGSSTNLNPMFNEVQSDGNSTDTNEFVEIIAPAGINLQGCRIEHRNGGETTDGPVWTFTFPSFVVPDDGVLAAGDVPLGFAVVSQNSNYVANTDFLLPGGLLNSGDGLILYDAQGNVLDAVVWLGATYDIGVDDPGTVSRNVPPGSKNYLHEIGTDSSTDTCPQAPNNVLMSTGTWYNATLSPGAINAQQISGSIVMAPGDSDLDAFLDDVDNCPDTFNPTQTDTDGDGIGDLCDPDLDGDGDLNANDNCPYVSNAKSGGHRRRRHRRRLRSGCRRRRHSERRGSPAVLFRQSHGGFRGSRTRSSRKPIPTMRPSKSKAARGGGVQRRAVLATNAYDRIDGLRGAKLRGAAGGIYLQGALTNGIGDLRFAYSQFGTSKGLIIKRNTTPAPAGWTISTADTLNATALTTNSATVNVVGPVDFRIVWTNSSSGGGTRYANLDNIWITSYTPPETGQAECSLDAAVAAAFNGSAITNTFTTVPAGLAYTVTYAPASPVEIGIYTATVAIPDSEYLLGGTFVYTNSVMITQGVATCELAAPISTGLRRTGAHQRLHRHHGPGLVGQLCAVHAGEPGHLRRHGDRDGRRPLSGRHVRLQQRRDDFGGAGHLHAGCADHDDLRRGGAHQRVHRDPGGPAVVRQLFAGSAARRRRVRRDGLRDRQRRILGTTNVFPSAWSSSPRAAAARRPSATPSPSTRLQRHVGRRAMGRTRTR